LKLEYVGKRRHMCHIPDMNYFRNLKNNRVYIKDKFIFTQ
jgi:hypothetical protein